MVFHGMRGAWAEGSHCAAKLDCSGESCSQGKVGSFTREHAAKLLAQIKSNSFGDLVELFGFWYGLPQIKYNRSKVMLQVPLFPHSPSPPPAWVLFFGQRT